VATNNSINSVLELTNFTVDPGASGDSYVQFAINTTDEFRIGVDDDAGDAFKISQGGALGSNDTFIMTAAGERTMPLQPAFLAIRTSDATNVTGDGTTYTVVYNSEVFDQGGDFDGTSTFTAPITGRYRLEGSALLGDLTSSHNGGFVRINTSNRVYLWQSDPGASRDATTNEYPFTAFCLADMDSADTATFGLQVVGSTLTVDVTSNGSTDPRTWFSGNLEV